MKTCKDTNIIENDVGRSTTITPASGLQDLHTRGVFITIPEVNINPRHWLGFTNWT